jgi:hypothetical protein
MAGSIHYISRAVSAGAVQTVVKKKRLARRNEPILAAMEEKEGRGGSAVAQNSRKVRNIRRSAWRLRRAE